MNQDLYDKIDDYLNGNLEGTHLEAFEKALASDETLAVEVEVFRLEKEGVELLVEDDLRNKMNRWTTQLPPKNTPNTVRKDSYGEGGEINAITKPKNRFWLWGGGLLLLGIGSLVWYFTQKKEDTPKPVIEKRERLQYPAEDPKKPNEIRKPINQKPYNPDIVIEKKPKKQVENKTTSPIDAPKADDPYLTLAYVAYEDSDFSSDVRSRSTNDNENDPLKSSLEAWDTDNFNQVIRFTQSFQKHNPVYYRAQELLGHAYFKMKNYAFAENVFANIAHAENGNMSEDAEWYELLCLMALKNKKEADALLNKILKDSGHRKNLEAQKLAASLKTLKEKKD